MYLALILTSVSAAPAFAYCDWYGDASGYAVAVDSPEESQITIDQPGVDQVTCDFVAAVSDHEFRVACGSSGVEEELLFSDPASKNHGAVQFRGKRLVCPAPKG